MFLLDTSFIIELLRRPSTVEKFLPEIDREDAKTTAMTVYEIFRRRSRMSRSEEMAFTRFFRSFDVFPSTHILQRRLQWSMKNLRKSEKT